MTVNLRDDPVVIARYKRLHEHVWPEVQNALRTVGILDMKIWLLGRRLFMYMETVDGFDPAVDFPRYLELDPRCQEWEDLMGEMQEAVAEAAPDEKWTQMEQVFELDVAVLR